MTTRPLLSPDDYFVPTGTAAFSKDESYRYKLSRSWGLGTRVMFLLLNPSTADASLDDPTIRRCINYAREWGYGGLNIGNIFALRSTDPKVLRQSPDPSGPENDVALQEMAEESAIIVAGYGLHGALLGRGQFVVEILLCDHPIFVLQLTREGYPGHPLYLPKSLRPVPWRKPPNGYSGGFVNGLTERTE